MRNMGMVFVVLLHHSLLSTYFMSLIADLIIEDEDLTWPDYSWFILYTVLVQVDNELVCCLYI